MKVLQITSYFVISLQAISAFVVPQKMNEIKVRSAKVSCGGANYINSSGACVNCRDSRATACSSPSGASTSCSYRNYVNNGLCSLCSATTYSAGGSGPCKSCGTGVATCNPGNGVIASCNPGWAISLVGGAAPTCIRACPIGANCDAVTGTPLSCLAGYAGSNPFKCSPCFNTPDPQQANTFALAGAKTCSRCDLFSVCQPTTGGITGCLAGFRIYFSDYLEAQFIYVLQCVILCPPGFKQTQSGKTCCNTSFGFTCNSLFNSTVSIS